MESFHITDNQLTSSSVHDKYSRHTSARLNMLSVTGVRSGGWVASHDDALPWIRIDFRANVTVRAIQTQGREDADEWVTSYEVSYGTILYSYDKFFEDGQVKVGLEIIIMINRSPYFSFIVNLRPCSFAQNSWLRKRGQLIVFRLFSTLPPSQFCLFSSPSENIWDWMMQPEQPNQPSTFNSFTSRYIRCCYLS